MLESLFGLRKKSKGGAESPAAGSTDVQTEKNEDSNKPGNAEKDTMKKPIEASPVPTVIKETVKLLETGKTSEGEDASVSNNKEEGGVTEDDCKDANIETEGKPVAIEVGDGDVNTITVSNEEEPKQAVETQNVTEDSVPVGNAELEKDVKNGEELRMENPEEAVKTDLTEPVCSGDESSKTAPKKKKSSGLFGGIFTRRKSKKSARTLEREAGDTVEALQHADSLVQVSGEVCGTEQATGTEDAAIKGDEDLTGQQKVETVDVLAHHSADDQNMDSKNDEIVEKTKVEAVVAGETPEVKVTEMETAEVENIVSEEIQKPSEKTLQSEETVQCAEKPAEEPTEGSVATDLNTKAQQAEDQITQPEIVLNSETATEEGTTNDRPTTEDLRKDADASKKTGTCCKDFKINFLNSNVSWSRMFSP